MKRLLVALSLISSPSYAATDNATIRNSLSLIQTQLDLINKKPQIEKWCGMHIKTLGYDEAVLDVDYEAGIWSPEINEFYVGCRIYIDDLLAEKSDSFSFVDFYDLRSKYKQKSKVKPKKRQTDCK